MANFIFAVNFERWCRLRGNLLFYFKSRDPWSEPIGLVVLEQCQVRLDSPNGSVSTSTPGHCSFYLGNEPKLIFGILLMLNNGVL